MDALASVVTWLFAKTIYGVAAVAALVYLALRALRKTFPSLPQPAFLAVPVFVIGILTLPSVPRYQFERETLARIEGKGWIRIVNRTNWGSLTEPLTWLRAPLGSITIVMPNSPIEGGFRQVTMRYEETPVVSIVEPDCADSTISRSRPDQAGVFRYTTATPEKMRDEERKWYCEHDWSTEKETLRKELLRRMKDALK
jgi:hypothetical protein